MGEEGTHVLVRCKASGNRLYVWFDYHWFSDVEKHIEEGRTLVAQSTRDTCIALQELMTQQEKENAN